MNSDGMMPGRVLSSVLTLMLIPQPLDDKGIDSPAEVVVHYEMTNTHTGEQHNGEATLPLRKPARTEWTQGEGTTYQIKITLLDGVHISFDIEGFIVGTDWVDRNSGTPVTGEVS